MTEPLPHERATSPDDATRQPGGTLRIGASARVADIAASALVREGFPVLAQACGAATTSEVSAGTLGESLGQRPRCWYLQQAMPCLKNGGSSCLATGEDGENQELAILDGGPCYAVNSSELAVALTALDALVEIASAEGHRTIPIAEFYVLPSERVDQETVLAPGERVSAVLLPRESAGGIQRYHKQTQTGSGDFVGVSGAGCKRVNGDVRLVLGGVAPRPWRVNTSVEEDVSSGGLDEDAIETLADRALYDAKPLSKNAYNVDLAAALLRQAIEALG